MAAEGGADRAKRSGAVVSRNLRHFGGSVTGGGAA